MLIQRNLKKHWRWYRMNKKGQMSGAVWGLVGVAVAFVVVALVLAFGAMILADTRTDMMPANASYTATCNETSGIYTGCDHAVLTAGYGLESTSKLSDKLPLIATVIVAVIIIGLLIAGFAGFMAGKR